MEKRASAEVMLEMLLHLRTENAHLTAENRRLLRENALLHSRFGFVESPPASAAHEHGDGVPAHLTHTG